MFLLLINLFHKAESLIYYSPGQRPRLCYHRLSSDNSLVIKTGALFSVLPIENSPHRYVYTSHSIVWPGHITLWDRVPQYYVGIPHSVMGRGHITVWGCFTQEKGN